MSDTKISALTALTGANVDSANDVLPIVDNNVTTTKKITRAQLFDISDAAGGQIVFPATQNASSGANTLDDYEEGTWTPVLTFATAGDLNVAYSVQVGTYTKVGRKVTVTCTITTSTFTHTTASGNCQVTGLPFTSLTSANHTWEGVMSWRGITKANYTQWNPVIASNAVLCTFDGCGSAQATSNLSAADMPTGGTVVIHFTLTYETA